jgi:hypothetical protein
VHPDTPPVRTDRNDAIDEVSFHELIAERLRTAPWLAVSAAAHAFALLLLWVLLPPDEQRRVENRVTVADTMQPEVELPTPPPVPEPQREVEPDPAVVDPTEVLLPQQEHDADSDRDHETNTVASAFLSSGANPTLGIGGGAAGPYGQRRRSSGPGGRPPATQAAVDHALRWLRDHQDEDGRWDCDQFMKHDDPAKPQCNGPGNPVHDVGVTGLALLAFLGDGNSMRAGPYRDTVRRAVLWLRSQQQDNGRFGGAASSDFVYDHAIAAYAMCEAYGLSQYQLLRDCAQRGVDYLESHRNPYGVWRYQPRDGDNDTSVTGWCVMAYTAAKHFGLQVNTNALQLAATWLDQVSDPSGLHGYSKAGEPSSRKPGDHAARFPPDRGHAMTAVGLFCRAFLEQDPREKPVMKAAADLLVQKPPVWDERAGAVDHYYWYYGSYALFQMGGPRWTAWQKKLEPAVLPHQHKDPGNMNLHGSWDPVCVWGDDGGRVYSTALLALTLQANYRYTRLVR